MSQMERWHRAREGKPVIGVAGKGTALALLPLAARRDCTVRRDRGRLRLATCQACNSARALHWHQWPAIRFASIAIGSCDGPVRRGTTPDAARLRVSLASRIRWPPVQTDTYHLGNAANRTPICGARCAPCMSLDRNVSPSARCAPAAVCSAKHAAIRTANPFESSHYQPAIHWRLAVHFGSACRLNLRLPLGAHLTSPTRSN